MDVTLEFRCWKASTIAFPEPYTWKHSQFSGPSPHSAAQITSFRNPEGSALPSLLKEAEMLLAIDILLVLNTIGSRSHLPTQISDRDRGISGSNLFAVQTA